MTLFPLGPLFKRKSLRDRLLVYCFTRPGIECYVRELAKLLGADPANLSRELRSLEREGIFRSHMRGNQKYFSLNRAYSFYDELRSAAHKIGTPPLSRAGKAVADVYVIAGPNGAGKTTFAKTFLKKFVGITTFLNADLIAGGLAPLAQEGAVLKAGKLLLEEIRHAAEKGIDFAFETTLSGRSYVRRFEDLRRRGYRIHLLFLWIPNVALSLKRIQERVRRGGHRIPEAVARRRFYRGLTNLFSLYQPLLDSWAIFDNSDVTPELLAYEEAGERHVLEEKKFSAILKAAGGP